MVDVPSREHGSALVCRELLRRGRYYVGGNQLRCKERTGFAVKQDRVLDLRSGRIDGDYRTALVRLRFQTD